MIRKMLTRLYDEVAFYRAFRKIKKIEGLLSPGQEKWLFLAVRSLPTCANILEIGAYLGRATASLALACVSSERHVFSVDAFGGIYKDVENSSLRIKFDRDFLEDWRENMRRAGVLRCVTPFRGDSKELAKIWDKQIHLLFIDGSHTYEDVIADFINFYPHVVEGGIIALHDVTPDWPGPFKAWHELIKHHLDNMGFCSTLAYGVKPKSFIEI